MRCLYGGVLAALLLSCLPNPAFAACVNAKCTDSTAIETARGVIQTTCGCTREGQKHGTYEKCVKSTLKAANLTALIPDKPCRKLIMKCEAQSICGKLTSFVCCATKKNGTVKASIVKTSAKCKKGSACGAMLGLYSTFDACDADGTCAGPTSTTTTPSNTTTTTTSPSGGSVLKGALTPTLGRFNYNMALGLPGATAACHTSFGASTHPCTYAELQSADTAGNLVGLKDTASTPVTSFWAIDASPDPMRNCVDDATPGSGLNWEYGTAHTSSRGDKVPLDSMGHLGALQASQQCAILGTPAWVGCCQ